MRRDLNAFVTILLLFLGLGLVMTGAMLLTIPFRKYDVLEHGGMGTLPVVDVVSFKDYTVSQWLIKAGEMSAVVLGMGVLFVVSRRLRHR